MKMFSILRSLMLCTLVAAVGGSLAYTQAEQANVTELCASADTFVF
jgi:hypothetical protein